MTEEGFINPLAVVFGYMLLQLRDRHKFSDRHVTRSLATNTKPYARLERGYTFLSPEKIFLLKNLYPELQYIPLAKFLPLGFAIQSDIDRASNVYISFEEVLAPYLDVLDPKMYTLLRKLSPMWEPVTWSYAVTAQRMTDAGLWHELYDFLQQPEDVVPPADALTGRLHTLVTQLPPEAAEGLVSNIGGLVNTILLHTKPSP